MKNYTITVNGNVYDVVVEEKTAGSAPVKTSAVAEKVVTEKKAAPVAEPVVVEEKKTEEKAPECTAGSIRIEAGAAGKVNKVTGSRPDKSLKREDMDYKDVEVNFSMRQLGLNNNY